MLFTKVIYSVEKKDLLDEFICKMWDLSADFPVDEKLSGDRKKSVDIKAKHIAVSEGLISEEDDVFFEYQAIFEMN